MQRHIFRWPSFTFPRFPPVIVLECNFWYIANKNLQYENRNFSNTLAKIYLIVSFNKNNGCNLKCSIHLRRLILHSAYFWSESIPNIPSKTWFPVSVDVKYWNSLSILKNETKNEYLKTFCVVSIRFMQCFLDLCITSYVILL